MSSEILNKTEVELSEERNKAKIEEIAKLKPTLEEIDKVVTEDSDEIEVAAEIGRTSDPETEGIEGHIIQPGSIRELRNEEPEKPRIEFILDEGKIRYRVCEPIILTTYSINSDTCTTGIYFWANIK